MRLYIWEYYLICNLVFKLYIVYLFHILGTIIPAILLIHVPKGLKMFYSLCCILNLSSE